MKTIAVINLGYIGDVINASPVCIALKTTYPDAKLIFITVPSSIETAKCLPYVDETIAFDRYNEHKGLKIFNLGLKIRKQYNIDEVIILTENFRSALLAFLTGAKKRIGRSNEGRDFLLTHRIPFTEEEKTENVHISDFYIRLTKPLLKDIPDINNFLNYSNEDKLYIKKLLNEHNYQGEDLIGFNPFSAREFKDWSQEEAKKFIQFINNNTDKKVAIIGTEKANKFCENLIQEGFNDFYNLTNKTTIPQLIALTSMFKTFVSVDSAPMHIALAFNIPTIALFFQKNYTKWGPNNFEKHKLMYNTAGIKAEEVIKQMNLCYTERLK
jgi:heptosyltransferase-2